MAQSRMEWLSEGEKPTSYFCKLDSKQFTEKTIRKLQINNGAILTDQKQIQPKKKASITEKSYVYDQIPPGILQHTSKPELGDLISNQELRQVLKKMKNNKSPGINGISADFIKVFWHKLKFFITNAINRCYTKGILTVSMRQSIITCLPKGDKACKLIKNWHPISLLTVVYKMASAVIAERLKPILKNVISTHQSGFISGRSIVIAQD